MKRHANGQQQPEGAGLKNVRQVLTGKEQAGAQLQKQAHRKAKTDEQPQRSMALQKLLHASTPCSRCKISRCSASGEDSFAQISAMHRPARIT